MTDEILTIDDIAVPDEWKNLLILPNAELLQDRKQIDNCPGIYAVYGADRQLAYIGKSKAVATRLRDHWLQTFFFNTVPTYFTFREIEDPILQRDMEVAHIHALRPPENMRYDPALWKRHTEAETLIRLLWGRT